MQQDSNPTPWDGDANNLPLCFICCQSLKTIFKNFKVIFFPPVPGSGWTRAIDLGNMSATATAH
jgi:hypothetical protein